MIEAHAVRWEEATSVSQRSVSGMVPSMMQSPSSTTTAFPRKITSPFRQTLQSAMPRLLTNGHKTPKEEMRELIAIVRPVALRERLLKVWAKL